MKMKKEWFQNWFLRNEGGGVRGLDLNISQTERFCFECAIINVIYDLKSI